MQKLSCFLFDLDDTLVESDPIRIRALEFSGHPHPKSLTLKEIRYKSPIALMKPYGRVNMNQYWKHYLCAAEKSARLTSTKLPTVLSRLKASGKSLGLVTSCPEHIARRVLEIIGIIVYFDSCIIGYVTCRKNKAKGISIALHKLNSPPEVSAYIGDSLKDYLASLRVGLTFCLASWSRQVISTELFPKAYRILKNVEDLLTL